MPRESTPLLNHYAARTAAIAISGIQVALERDALVAITHVLVCGEQTAHP